MRMNGEAGASQSGRKIGPGVVGRGLQHHEAFFCQRAHGIYLISFSLKGGVCRGGGNFQKARGGAPSRDRGEINGRIRIYLHAEIGGVRLVDLPGKQRGTEEGNSHIIRAGEQGIRQLYGFGKKPGSQQKEKQSELSEEMKEETRIRIFHGRIVMVVFWVMYPLELAM
jgi:hypothetical protein